MYFLDTPVFGARMFGSEEERARINRLIDASQCGSSIYVREQYRYTFLDVAIAVHNYLKAEDDLGRTFRKFTEVGKWPAEKDRALKVLATLLENRQGQSVADILAVLEQWIEREILDKFDDGILVTDETGCCFCHGDVVLDENGYYFQTARCTQDQPRPCRIDQFWSVRSHELTSLAAYDLDSLSAGHKKRMIRVQEHAQRIVDGKSPRGQRCWAFLSDAVIVCESDDGTVLGTTNLKDFVPLARMIPGGRTATNPLVDEPDE